MRRRIGAGLPAVAGIVVFVLGGIAAAAVFGTDERRGLGANTHRHFRSVGLLFSNHSDALDGTAVLIGPRHILSAAHVLYEDGALRVPLDQHRFRIGADFVNQSYEETGLERIIDSGTTRPYMGDDALARDWIVVELEDPIRSAVPARADIAAAKNPSAYPLHLAGYHADVHDGLRRVKTRCHFVEPPGPAASLPEALRGALRFEGVWLHDCDTAGHSSGAGLFARKEDGSDRLIGLNVGAIGPARAERVDLTNGSVNLAIAVSERMQRHFERGSQLEGSDGRREDGRTGANAAP